MGLSESPRLRVAVVAPSLRILGGQAVQADRLLGAWRDDPDVDAWLVPVNPVPWRPFRWALRTTYIRTVVTQLAYWPLLVRELRRADLVHVFSASYFSFLLAPLPALLIARALGKPVLLNYRSGEAPDHLRRSAVARLALARVECNVVPSGFLRDVFASFGIDARVIQNIVDLDRFRFRTRVPLRPKLVSTRNFDKLYNVACTLRAFRIVQDRYPEADLTLVGDGPERVRLEQLARDLSLRNVTFAGRVNPDDIWRHYDRADIYVQSPDIDNMPASVLEAYAAGLPVVSTNAGGVPYIVEHEREGLLAAVDDDRAIGQAVLRLLNEPVLAERFIRAGRAHVARCTWSHVRQQWVDVYRELTAPRTVPASAVQSLR
jgi:glycosyltransferase involved in cell wall biosynthesis